MARKQRTKGERIGDWVLERSLGSGGNADVWKVEGSEFALKILRDTRKSSEPFKRFEAEIDILKALAGRNGILPLIKHNLPQHPSDRDPAWILMPVAVPLPKSFATERALRPIVSAVATIARTLSDLADQGIFHRDIKPENMFMLEGSSVIGDFGLAERPDGDALTQTGRLIGSKHYLAPELFLPGDRNYGPSDVFALAKSLWALAGQFNQPVPGQIVRGIEALRLPVFAGEESTAPMEWLIERATDTKTSQRPSMKEFCDELERWLRPEVVSTELDAGELSRIIMPAAAALDAKDAKFNERKQHLNDEIANCRVALEKIAAVIAEASKRKCSCDRWAVFSDAPQYKRAVHSPTTICDNFLSYILEIDGNRGAQNIRQCLCGGIGAILGDDDTVTWVAYHVFRISSSEPVVVWELSGKALRGSMAEINLRQDLLIGLSESTKEAVRRFFEAIAA